LGSRVRIPSPAPVFLGKSRTYKIVLFEIPPKNL
jgi:hypothetical protein